MTDNGFGLDIGKIPVLISGRSRSISAENPKGEKGAGGKAASNLGPGRKGNPCIKLPHGETVVLAETEGPGVIQHIWLTVTNKTSEGNNVLRDLVLRMYWDGEEKPSVETPLGDFFCNGFGTQGHVNSIPVVVNPRGGMNCYFSMPFRKSARITIENQHVCDIGEFFYQISYTLLDALPEDTVYFHAQWRRENCTQEKVDYTIVEGISGKGYYFGTFLAWAALGRYWWGEGEIKFFLDGDDEWPTICGTGTEDYFGGAFCFHEKPDGYVIEQTYSTPFLGHPFCSNTDDSKADIFGEYSVPRHGLFRWHMMDPICFEKDLRVTIQQIGHNGHGLYERTDDISSVAYWYQTEPHRDFPALPEAVFRWPR